jgi:hypothetical protein
MTTIQRASPAQSQCVYLSGLRGRHLADRAGQRLGRLSDVIVRLDFLALPGSLAVSGALAAVTRSRSLPPEALTSVHAVITWTPTRVRIRVVLPQLLGPSNPVT